MPPISFLHLPMERIVSVENRKKVLILKRRIKYYCIKFVRLRGEPHKLALGFSLGVFTGLMPIMPFQIALAVTLSLFFKGSKITAALGTWISNPLNWYFLYYFNYKLGKLILGVSVKDKVFLSVVESIRQGEGISIIIGKMAGASGTIISTFLLGGVVMGVFFAIPSYFIFKTIFQFIQHWRIKRRKYKHWQRQNQ